LGQPAKLQRAIKLPLLPLLLLLLLLLLQAFSNLLDSLIKQQDPRRFFPFEFTLI
jgi:hypothetical protein